MNPRRRIHYWQNTYLRSLQWWSTCTTWGISNFAGVKNAEKLNYNRQLNPSGQQGSKFYILLFLSVEFGEMATSEGKDYLLFFSSRRFQPSCPEAALPFTSIHHTLVWFKWLSIALLKEEMVIKSDISYAPVSLESICRIPFSPLEQKNNWVFFFHSSFWILQLAPSSCAGFYWGYSSSISFLTFLQIAAHPDQTNWADSRMVWSPGTPHTAQPFQSTFTKVRFKSTLFLDEILNTRRGQWVLSVEELLKVC